MLTWLKSLFGTPEAPVAAPPTALEAALSRWRRAGRPAEQVTALEALAELGGPEARAAVEAAAQDHSSIHAQIAAARLLGDLGGPSAVAVLERVADHAFWAPSEEARARGASGMGVGRAGGLSSARADEKLVRQACENALKRLRGG